MSWTLRLSAALALSVVSQSAWAQLNPGREQRRVTDAELVVDFERFELPNGLVVLLSTDQQMSGVLVDMSFRAGTYFEAPGRTGLAHIVEHLMFRGPREGTQYDTLLESRGASQVEAYTSAYEMLFRIEVPATELPLALWVHADRLRTLPGLLESEDLPRHLSVVGMEKIWRYGGRPYAEADKAIHGLLFPSRHPLEHNVIGLESDWERISMADVQRFADQCLNASNAVVTLVGNFDPVVAKRWIEKTLGTLPPGPKPQPHATPKVQVKRQELVFKEMDARQPRVTMLWHFDKLGEAELVSLDFGARLLSNYVDGAFGTQVQAVMQRHDGGGSFRLDVTLPYDKPIDAAQGEAEVFLRYLTAVDVPRELWNLTRLLQELQTLHMLDQPQGRAALLTAAEVKYQDPARGSSDLVRHWSLTRQSVRLSAWENLISGASRSVIHARPVRPRKAKLHWEDR